MVATVALYIELFFLKIGFSAVLNSLSLMGLQRSWRRSLSFCSCPPFTRLLLETGWFTRGLLGGEGDSYLPWCPLEVPETVPDVSSIYKGLLLVDFERKGEGALLLVKWRISTRSFRQRVGHFPVLMFSLGC